MRLKLHKNAPKTGKIPRYALLRQITLTLVVALIINFLSLLTYKSLRYKNQREVDEYTAFYGTKTNANESYLLEI
jgi:hypothetical protein